MRRYEPYHGYFDEWDEDGSAMMREAKDGEWTKYENARNAIKMYTNQIERLKKENEYLKKMIKEIKNETIP